MSTQTQVAARSPLYNLPVVEWWRDSKLIALVKRTAFKTCNDTEFDEAVAVSRELNLNPLRKQIYAFVFNAEDDARRQMVLVVAIQGARALAARTGNYRPDDVEPVYTYLENLKGPANPHGIEKCTIGVWHRPTKEDEWRRIVGVAYWSEFAPIIRDVPADDVTWEDTGEVWPDTKKPKKRKVVKAGAVVTEILDPKKDGWRKMARLMIAKCAEKAALDKGWPDDLSRVLIDEEIDRSTVIDGEWSELSPSELVHKASTAERMEKLGGEKAVFGVSMLGIMERVPVGQFADWFLAMIKGKTPEEVTHIQERNKVALREYWGYAPGDALALKKILEERTKGATSTPVPKAAASAPAEKIASAEAASDGSAPRKSADPEAISFLSPPPMFWRLPDPADGVQYAIALRAYLAQAKTDDQLETVWDVISEKIQDAPSHAYELALGCYRDREAQLAP